MTRSPRSAPFFEGNDNRRTRVVATLVHNDCGKYRITFYPYDTPPRFCPACGMEVPRDE